MLSTLLLTTSICLSLSTSVLSSAFPALSPSTNSSVCTVQPNGDPSQDDAPAIIDAFSTCGQGGKIVFLNETYHVNSVMNTTGLKGCEVDLMGTLLWSTNISYWLNNSLPVGYQNQSSAWFFGGTNVHFNGFGYGTIDGNGQVWYDFIDGQSNYPRRPHAITIWETYDSVFEGLRFVQSQMWTMTVKNSANVLLQDIYVNSTSSTGSSVVNTDGADTLYANNITFSRWDVTNGDDCIATKANSTDIFIYDSTCRKGVGIAVGSIGQYPGQFEIITNMVARNITMIGTQVAGKVKTWTGVQKGVPPNGGGAGLGYTSNIDFQNFTLIDVGVPFSITQCTNFEGGTGDCDTSQFQIENLTWGNMTGTTSTPYVAELACSGATPCPGVRIENMNVKQANGSAADQYLCGNLQDPEGFNCTGACPGSPFGDCGLSS